MISIRCAHAAVGVALALACGRAFASSDTPPPVSFRSEVMAVLSKAGCNAGACHGNANGKGGFKLSLRGEDPAADYASVTRDALGRRINPLEPDGSLLLLKPTSALAHEGGKRFDPASPEYAILRHWIARGAPDDTATAPRLVGLEVEPRERIVLAPVTSVALSVRARFADGRSRGVSRLAVYEPTATTVTVTPEGLVEAAGPGEVVVLARYLDQQVPVRLAFVPAQPGFTWPEIEPRNAVDEHLFAKLKRLRIRPAQVADDATFVRRATLDLLGILPTAQEARAFVRDPSPDKRARWIDHLLGRAEFADYWALKWSDLLRLEEKALDRKGVELFHRWIRDGIEDGKPIDRFVREILTAQGSTYQNPPANFYRSLRSDSSRAETIAQVFLGTRLLCAQCHNHPFDRWTQADYHEWSGVFTRVRYKVLENRYPDGLDKHGFTGEQIVYAARDGESRNPKTGDAAPARLLGAPEPLPADHDRLEAAANWIVANPLFARVQVNRIWYHLMGRGLVDPVDDFRATNPPSHPELLEYLTREFVDRGFDLRHVVRLVMNSHAYQAASEQDPTAAYDRSNATYAHTPVRRLDAEQTLDALSQVAGAPLAFAGYPEGLRAGQIPGVQAVRVRRRGPGDGERFLRVFGKPERLLASEEERSCQTTLGQAFQLITGPVITDLLARPGNRLDQLLARGASSAEMLDELFWTALTRPPTAEESSALNPLLDAASTPEARRAALEDVTWALVNAKEFILRH